MGGRFSVRGLFVGRTASARGRFAVAHEQPFSAFVRRVNQVKVIDAEFFEFFPQALFELDGMHAALFLGEDVPGIEADAFGKLTIREADDKFFPEGFLAKFIVAEHVGGFFFKFLGDLVTLVELVKFDDIGVTGVEQVFEYLVFEGIDGCHFSLEGGSLVPLGHKRGEGEKFDEGVDLGVCEAKIHDGVECGDQSHLRRRVVSSRRKIERRKSIKVVSFLASLAERSSMSRASLLISAAGISAM